MAGWGKSFQEKQWIGQEYGGQLAKCNFYKFPFTNGSAKMYQYLLLNIGEEYTQVFCVFLFETSPKYKIMHTV